MKYLDSAYAWLSPLGLRFSYYDVSGSWYPVIFEFERMCESVRFLFNTKTWMEQYWWTSMVIAALYVVLIFAGQALMRNRRPFDARRQLIIWNFCLATFSIMGALRTFPELAWSVWNRGLSYSTCNIENINSVCGTWAWLFALSKVPELGDTVFIVLRKQKLIFLHWFHHATVLVYTWYAFHDWTATGRWFITMNYTVHAFMYTYYYFRAMRYRVPKPLAMVVTTMQLSQMAVGCFVNARVYFVLKAGEHCRVSWNNIGWSFFMYAVYFLLFCHFFVNAYVRSKWARPSAKRPVERNIQAGLSDQPTVFPSRNKMVEGKVMLTGLNGYLHSRATGNPITAEEANSKLHLQ